MVGLYYRQMGWLAPEFVQDCVLYNCIWTGHICKVPWEDNCNVALYN